MKRSLRGLVPEFVLFPVLVLSLILLFQNTSVAAPAACPDGLINVAYFGARSGPANNSAAFAKAYTAATTNNYGCKGLPIFIPGNPNAQWIGSFPNITSPVTIEGAGRTATNLAGFGGPVLNVFAPVTLKDFGFWNNTTVGIALNTGSDGSTLNNLYCRGLPPPFTNQYFIYVGPVSNVTMTGLKVVQCGYPSGPMSGGAVTIMGANNITLNAFESFGSYGPSVAMQNSSHITFNGGKTDYSYAVNAPAPFQQQPQIYVLNSSVTMSNGFYFAGTNRI